MRVLLIHAPYVYPNSCALRTELLGLAYLAAVLRQLQYEVFIYDSTIETPRKLENGSYYYGATEKEFAEKIEQYSPDVVGISCHYAYSHKEAYKIARLAKKVNSRIVTVLGGLFPSIFREKALHDCQALDYEIIGEAEQSFPDLLSELSSKTPELEKIDGLIYRRGKEVVVNEKKSFVTDLDSLPYPARDLFDIQRYMNLKSSILGLGSRPTLSLLTSRSCPYKCAFCNMWLVHGPKWRARSAENVLGEIEEIVNKYRAEHVFIMDDNFTFDPERVKKICEGIIRKGYRFKWNTPNGISVKKIDREMVQLMKRAGCTNVCVAIESGSEYIRNKVMRKMISNSEIEKTVRLFDKEKLPVGAFVIIGMPEETEERFSETIRFVKSLPLSYITMTFAIPFPGTKLHEYLVEKGYCYNSLEVGMCDYNIPVFATEDFTKEDLIKRRTRLFYSFYLNNIPRMFSELIGGRLNWISPQMIKKGLKEKVFGAAESKMKF